MSILKKLGYKQRIVIMISLVLAVSSHFLPEPKSIQEPPPMASSIQQAIDITAVSSSIRKEQFTGTMAHPAKEQMPENQTRQLPLQPSFSLEEKVVSIPDLFILPATPDLFPPQLPQTAPVHQSPLNLE